MFFTFHSIISNFKCNTTLVCKLLTHHGKLQTNTEIWLLVLVMKSSKLTDRLLLGFSKIIHVTQTYLVYLEKIKNQY